VPEPIEHNGAADHEIVHLHLLCRLGAITPSIENI
jgi:hypothetical protein